MTPRLDSACCEQGEAQAFSPIPMPDPLAPNPLPAPGGPSEGSVIDDASILLSDVVDELEPKLEQEMQALDTARRMLLVHAHPNDETISTGATMARYAAEGALVVLVTCTLGEEGDVHLPGMAKLGTLTGEQLGEHRQDELAKAVQALGVRDHRYLGGVGRYRDSGLAGSASNNRLDAFAQADVEVAAWLLADVVREIRPQVVITDAEHGGNGHPDHRQAHQVSVRALQLAADPQYGQGEPWQTDKLYLTAIPRSVLEDQLAQVLQAGEQYFTDHPVDQLPTATDDDEVTTCIDATDQWEAKLAAMRAHASQFPADSPFFALAATLGPANWGREYYQLAAVNGEMLDRAARAEMRANYASEDAYPQHPWFEDDLFL